MRRRLLNLVTVLSFLLCVALVAMSLRSFWVIDWAARRKVEPGSEYWTVTEWSADLCRGAVLLGEFRRQIPNAFAGPVDDGPLGTTWVCGSDDSFHGIHAHVRQFYFALEPRFSAIAFPLWLPALLFSLLPVYRLHRRLRARQPGLCSSCGYDLRATPDRCPECGAAPGIAAESE